MSRQLLLDKIRKKRSFLCVGLDSDPHRLPAKFSQTPDGVFAFNRDIIDATAPYAIAFKPNTAFYEAQGEAGWQSLVMTVKYIRQHHPDVLVIADAKRGDIGNTSDNYARAFFGQLNADAITVAPYMGYDSVRPFLTYKDKWTILLVVTSNEGSADFQQQRLLSGRMLYEEVALKAAGWAGPDQLMFVVGATRPSELGRLRRLLPQYFFLVPGVGVQGGSLNEVAAVAMNQECGIIVNASRTILYASSGSDFAFAAQEEAKKMQLEMSALLQDKGVI